MTDIVILVWTLLFVTLPPLAFRAGLRAGRLSTTTK